MLPDVLSSEYFQKGKWNKIFKFKAMERRNSNIGNEKMNKMMNNNNNKNNTINSLSCIWCLSPGEHNSDSVAASASALKVESAVDWIGLWIPILLCVCVCVCVGDLISLVHWNWKLINKNVFQHNEQFPSSFCRPLLNFFYVQKIIIHDCKIY